jgi:hypothetical protein
MVVKVETEGESNLESNKMRTLANKLLSSDVSKYVELRDQLLSDDNNGSHCLYVHCSTSTVKPDIERCRAIALSASEELWANSEFYQVLYVCDPALLTEQCEKLLKDGELSHRALIWLDMKPADAKNIDTELIEQVCEKHEGGASFLLTLQAADAEFEPPDSFCPLDIKDAQEPRLEASTLLGEIKFIIKNPDEPYTPTTEWLEAFDDLLRNTLEVLCKHNVPVAGLYAMDKVRARHLAHRLAAAERRRVWLAGTPPDKTAVWRHRVARRSAR